MNDKMHKEVKFLKFYSCFLTIALVGTMIYTFSFSTNQSFKEIDVERINIIERSGDLKMVISNSERQHSGAINGKPLPKRDRQPGIIFFNSVGDECGGLVYDGNDSEAGLVLSVDKYREDQIMQMRYIENTEKNKRTYGMQFWDYQKEDAFDERNAGFNRLKEMDDKESRNAAYAEMKKEGLLPADRMFVGKRMNEDVGVFINDREGNPRIKIYINQENNPKIELLDENGNLVSCQCSNDV